VSKATLLEIIRKNNGHRVQWRPPKAESREFRPVGSIRARTETLIYLCPRVYLQAMSDAIGLNVLCFLVGAVFMDQGSS